MCAQWRGRDLESGFVLLVMFICWSRVCLGRGGGHGGINRHRQDRNSLFLLQLANQINNFLRAPNRKSRDQDRAVPRRRLSDNPFERVLWLLNVVEAIA